MMGSMDASTKQQSITAFAKPASHVPSLFGVVPGLIGRAGEPAARRFVEFFTANIRNPNTRRAYARAVNHFFHWCEQRSIALHELEPMLVAAYIEQHPGSAPSKKQALAAIRMLFDWLVIGQVLPLNPASSVRGPKHITKRGKTAVLEADQARQLLDSLDIRSIAGLRDRALIGVMVYSFARVSAVVGMNVGDYLSERQTLVVPIPRERGKVHEVPAHSNAKAYLDAYLCRSDYRPAPHPALPRVNRHRTLGSTRLTSHRRLPDDQATRESGRLCPPQRAANVSGDRDHRLPPERRDRGKSPAHCRALSHRERLKLYDRTNLEITVGEVERIVI